MPISFSVKGCSSATCLDGQLSTRGNAIDPDQRPSAPGAPGRAELTVRWALLVAAVFGLAVSGSALAGQLGEVEAKFDASFSPKVLAKSKQTPISLHAAMGFGMPDGSRTPALQEFEIAVDRHARLSLKGVPACRPGNVEELPIQQRCKKALIGSGKAVIDIRFPESTIPPVHSIVRVYNAGLEHGTRTLYASIFLTAPTPAAVVFTVMVKKATDGRYGLELVGRVPKIAGGSGSITHLGFRFRKGIFSATCADRRLQIGFGATFVDGTHLSEAVLRTCTPSP